MSTVAEIEAAIDRLPAAELSQLRAWLANRGSPALTLTPGEQEAWLARMAALRAQVATGKTAATTDAFWDDLREERGV